MLKTYYKVKIFAQSVDRAIFLAWTVKIIRFSHASELKEDVILRATYSVLWSLIYCHLYWFV